MNLHVNRINKEPSKSFLSLPREVRQTIFIKSYSLELIENPLEPLPSPKDSWSPTPYIVHLRWKGRKREKHQMIYRRRMNCRLESVRVADWLIVLRAIHPDLVEDPVYMQEKRESVIIHHSLFPPT
ncbi:hypothetical protein E6O75_ATG05735 [Venturia nashicola]|uniref:Uncharacterized protein n=1 Tax=Venturia nashicola TaxID=86259 RepID=A0A4Z1PE62_9PEZI|nr:hypothetical protein E6O75_ATG05735 [Venturia nashicola]